MDQQDLQHLLEWVSAQPELAFLSHAKDEKARNIEIASNIESAFVRQHWSEQRRRAYEERFASLKWCAFDRMTDATESEYLIWHKPSGPVLVEEEKFEELGWTELEDPFLGWTGWSRHEGKIPAVQWDDNIRHFFIDVEFESDNAGLCTVCIFGTDWSAAPTSIKNYWRRFKRYLEQRASPVKIQHDHFSEDCTWSAWPSAARSVSWIKREVTQADVAESRDR
jgi:hypothetical protein